MTYSVEEAVISQMVKVCCDHEYEGDDVFVTIPYIPRIPKQWNGVLVLAESQNMSEITPDELAVINKLPKTERAMRVHDRFATFNGVGPWDDGELRFVYSALFPNGLPDECAVGNAVPWTARPNDGRNANPNAMMQRCAKEYWSALLRVWEPKPSFVILCGKIARHVVAPNLSEHGVKHFIELILPPSTPATGVISRCFDTDNMLERFPEVNSALARWRNQHGRLKYEQQTIAYACHAVSKFSRIASDLPSHVK